ncbi:MAG: hypothetical protein CNLJKLNK_00871 [Holosporales bacterium]
MFIHVLKGAAIFPYLEKLSLFEKEFVYPSNDGIFKISHGKRYDRFFSTLRFNCDEPVFIIATDKDINILGIIVAVLQELPTQYKPQNAWYICDFKISKKVQDLTVLKCLLKTLKNVATPICDKAYALSMNTKGKENRIVHFATRNLFSTFKNMGNGTIYLIQNNHDFLRLKKLYGSAYLLRATDLKTIIINDDIVDLWHFIPSYNVPNKAFEDFFDVFDFNNDKEDFSFDNRIVLAQIPNAIESLSVFGFYSILQRGLDHIDWSFLTPFDI